MMTEGDIKAALLRLVGGSERFESSFSLRTHYPRRAAECALESGVVWALEGVAAVGAGMAPLWLERFYTKWAKYQAAGARTANWFITGAANFPVERNKKRMATEHARYEDLKAHVDGAAAWARSRVAAGERAARVAEDAASGVVHESTEVGGVRMVRNTALDRVQLFFPDRPGPEIYNELKRRAFRWAPSLGAWQRQLTRNGIWAAEYVLSKVAASS